MANTSLLPGANGLESEFSRSYNTFSGSDIKAVIGSKQFAELQAISYSVTREKAPIYTMGSPDPRAYSRNKRGIAGSLIWINFDRHALLDVFYKTAGKFVANTDDIRPQFQALTDKPFSQTAIFNSTLERTVGLPIGATVNQLDTLTISEVSALKEFAAPWYSDQVLPFDVTLAGNNEYGASMAMRIYGIEILNEGSGVSIDDAVSEMQATFVARYVQPWHVVKTPFGLVG
jgi:hypothetical protein